MRSQMAQHYSHSYGVNDRPSLFLWLVIKLAPLSLGNTVDVASPAAYTCIQFVEGQFMAILRWLGCKPSGPGADPLGKGLTPFKMADSEVCV